MPGAVVAGRPGAVVAGRVTTRQARRALLETLFRAALDALDPDVLIGRVLEVVADGTAIELRVDRRRRVRLPLGAGVIVVGAGKGAAGLAAAVERRLGASVRGGLVIVPPGSAVPLAAIDLAYGGHPIPTRGSVHATRRLLRMVASAKSSAVLVLLTGGASALMAAPAPGITLRDKRRTGELLLASGASIDEMNVVRKHLSAIKGGRLATRVGTRPAATLVLSDVPGDDLSVIGSGPTVADPTSFADALQVLVRTGIMDRVPTAVRRRLQSGARGRCAETPKPGTPALRRASTLLLAGNQTARAGAARAARRAGLAVRILRTPLTGSTTAAATRFARQLDAFRARVTEPTLVVAGGETTVRLGPTAGRGGRNQEFALEVARVLANRPGWALLSVGTDGIDGPTDAAGAYVDGQTRRRVARGGGTLDDALARHDAYPLLRGLGDLVITGPTGTNVADLKLGLIWPAARWRPPPGMIEAGTLRMDGHQADVAGRGGRPRRSAPSLRSQGA